MAGKFIDVYYGEKILDDGDIRKHPPYPPHSPNVLYIMGSADRYEWEKTREAYNHWYNGREGSWGHWPAELPDHKKWFILVEGARHSDGEGPYVWDWPHYWTVIDQAVEITLREAGKPIIREMNT